MKKRILINRTDRMKYISHLEFIHFLEKFMKRIKIRVQYSEGFHPRPKFVFGNPVSLGMESFNEPVDITLVNDISNQELRDLMNKYAPIGFKTVEVIDLGERNNINRDYNCITYDIKAEKSVLDEIVKFISSENVIVRKEKEGKVTETDVKLKIKKYAIENEKIKIWLEEISPKFILRTLGVEEKCLIVRTGYEQI